ATVSKSSKRAGFAKSHDTDTRGKPHFTPSARQLTVSPWECRKSVSADSMKRKKLAKCMIPAMSVSPNSTRRVVVNGFMRSVQVSYCESGWNDINATSPRLSPLGRGRHLAPARWQVRGLVLRISPSPGLLAALANHPLPNGDRVQKGAWFLLLAVLY